MTPAAMLICPAFSLSTLPDAERDVLRRFFTEYVRGVDTESDKRWRRFAAQLFRAAPGEGFHIAREEERSLPFHARHRVILGRLFASQERFRHIDALHDWLKVGAAFVTWGENKMGNLKAIPRSTAFDLCSEDDIREAHVAMIDYLHEPRSQRYLWPHLKPNMRADMLASVLTDQEGHK